MKNERQATILELIKSMTIDTQDALAAALRAKGFDVTQATVSRDIKELGLVKAKSAASGGVPVYASVNATDQSLLDRFIRVFRESVISVDAAGNLIVLRTITGSANAASAAIDHLKWSEIIGTVAGDDTILAVTATPETAREVLGRFTQMMHQSQ